MATISKLVVEISAKAQKLKSALDKSLKNVKSFVKKAVKSFALIGGAIAAAFTVGLSSAIGAINRTAEELDELAKTSAKLGTTVAALQELQFQAALTGVSAEKLNMGLQRMVRRVSEAAKGTGEAVKALKELGLDARELAKLSPEKQFRRISDAMKRVGSQTDRVRLAFKLFDSEGVALVNTLNSNLDETSKEFKTLGVAITQQQAQAVAAYQDAITKLGFLWQGFLNQLTVQTAPAFTNLLNFITDTIKRMGGMGEIAKVVAKVIISAVNSMIKAFSSLLDGIDSVLIGLAQVQLAYAKVRNFVDVANPLRLAVNKFKGDVPQSFLDRAKLESEINRIQQRRTARQQFTNEAVGRGQKIKMDIAVKADKDSVIEDIKLSQQVDAIVKEAIQIEINRQARANDR